MDAHRSERWQRRILREPVADLTLRHRREPVTYYRTREGFEVDFVVPRGRSHALIQACADLRGVETREREIRALVGAMRELGVREGTIVTAHERGEEKVAGGTIRIVPAWRWALDAAAPAGGKVVKLTPK